MKLKVVRYMERNEFERLAATLKKSGICEIEAHRIVVEIWSKFRHEPGNPVVLDLCEGEDRTGWMSLEQYKNANYKSKERQALKDRVMQRMKPLMKKLTERMMLDADNFRYRFAPAFQYIGDGQVALYWKRRIPPTKNLKNEGA